MSIPLVLLLVLLLSGLWSIWTAFNLGVRKKYGALTTYKGARPDQMPSLARSHALLMLAFGAWLFALPFLVVLFRIPFSSWSALVLVGTAGLFVGKRVVERRHGLPHS
ncbi:hypothetical protein [Roseateles sp. BYS87W]|uniref:SdpI/YhfL protein family protein n=1 Tax=Pelomonas baiyunensis TaxID=3299026 RepID=A0ABW7GTN7_9BURK